MFKFLKKAFRDMRESARAQHEVDKANLKAHKAEARATWEEAKMSPTGCAEKMQEERDEHLHIHREETKRFRSNRRNKGKNTVRFIGLLKQ